MDRIEQGYEQLLDNIAKSTVYSLYNEVMQNGLKNREMVLELVVELADILD